MKKLIVVIAWSASLALPMVAFAQKKTPPPPRTPQQIEEDKKSSQCAGEAIQQNLTDPASFRSYMTSCMARR